MEMEPTLVPRPVPRPRRLATEIKKDREDQNRNYINVTIAAQELTDDEGIEAKSDENPADEVDFRNNNVFVDHKNPYSDILSKVTDMSVSESVDNKPKPAPRNKTLQKNLQQQQQYENTIIKDRKEIEISSGAIKKQPIRKAPDLPSTSDNDHRVQVGDYDDKGYEISPKLKNRSPSSNSLNSSENSDRYRTSSPGHILRSIGASSKLLTEAITERVTQKTKGARKKIMKTSRDTLTSISTETTSRILNAKNKYIPTLTLGRSKSRDPDIDPERPVTLPVDDSIFNSIQFNSPLKSKSKNCENLTDSTYEIPRKSKMGAASDDSSQLSVDCPSYEEAIKSDSLFSNSSSSWSPLDERKKNKDKEIESIKGEVYKNLSEQPSSSRMVENYESNTDSPLTRKRGDIDSKGHFESEIVQSDVQDSLVPEISRSNSKDFESSSISSPEVNIPCPSFPPPILDTTPLYGKINKKTFSSSDDETGKLVQEIRAPPPRHRSKNKKDEETCSNRATVDPNEFKKGNIYPTLDKLEPEPSSAADRSEFWAFYDEVARDCSNLNPIVKPTEPLYSNSEPVYGTVFEASNSQAGPSSKCAEDIIKEFDPLLNNGEPAKEFSNKSNHLILLESLLSEETYGSIDDDNITDDQSAEISDDDNVSIVSDSVPQLPQRIDSLRQEENKPKSVDSSKHSKTVQPTMIIHQNMRLRCDSMENMVDDSDVDRYLTRVEPNPVPPVDFGRPQPQTSFFYVDGSTSPGSSPSTNPHNNFNDSKDESSSAGPPPSYQDVLKEKALLEGRQPQMTIKLDSDPLPKSSSTSSMMSKFSNVFNKSLLRKSSFKGAHKPTEVMTVLEMVPRPPLADISVNHEGHLVRIPTGVVEDILKELQFRHSMLKGHKFYTFLNSEHKNPKESFPMDQVTTIQSIQNHKFSSTGQTEMYCFEITVSLPKSITAHPINTNPNLVLTSTNSGNSKTSRLCHVYGCVKQSDRSVWMQKLVENMTDVFPKTATQDYKRMGWCYMKNSISGNWSGAWILLQRRKLMFFNATDKKLEVLDLRKARCIVLKECDDSINNLHVENGPMMMIDCPPFTLYAVMNCPRETKVWRHIIKEEAHNNGLSLKNQQLTKDNIPVLVDKCINFIYTHGSMSEGIYRKSGSENSITKLLTGFREDAFSIQLTRTEYSEHDIATALKRFMRDLPEPLLGKYTVSFLSVSALKSTPDKLQSYKELLGRLPTIEHQTLRKLLGHLNFIQSQRAKNKMGVENLAMLWGPTLMADKKTEQIKYSTDEANVMGDFIGYYKYLFHPTQEELKKEEVMLAVLQKYHAAAENLSDTVKQSGDLKVWIQIELGSTDNSDENLQVSVTLTPTKTVHDLCKELKSKTQMEAYQLTLYEVILNGELERPMHYKENVLDSVLRWTTWPDSDRKTNCLKLKQNKFMIDVERALKNLPSVNPNTELKFAESKSKTLKPLILELINGKINILKKEKNSEIKLQRTLEVKKVIAFLGCEKKRDSQFRWTITLIDRDFKKRSREIPYIGHVLAGSNSNDQIMWYACILHSMYGNNLMPTPEFL